MPVPPRAPWAGPMSTAPGTAPGNDENDPLTPPDPGGLEAWIRQVLRLAGPGASAFPPPPLPPSAPEGPAPDDGDTG
ncbi:hypothetical protein TBS_15190 [Thermobispora bispora]